MNSISIHVKSIQVIGRPAPESAPDLFQLLAGSSSVTETRLYDWSTPQDGRPTVLFEVDGDGDEVQDELVTMPSVRAIDVTPITTNRFTLLVVLELAEIPLVDDILGALIREGLVVVKPIVYRDSQVHAQFVGRAPILQTAVSDFPPDIDIEIVAVGEFDRSRETPVSGLSDRQRAALLAAFDLGYYEQPRQATHKDVAARIGCAPNTASEHLQKAEMKVITNVLQFEFER